MPILGSLAGGSARGLGGLGLGASIPVVALSNYESISTATVSSPQASVTLNIPAGYKHIQIRYSAKCGRGGPNNGFLWVRYNSSFPDVMSTMAASTSTFDVTVTPIEGNGYQAMATGTSANASAFGFGILTIFDYANTNKTKQIMCWSGTNNPGSGQLQGLSASYINSTSTITSVTFGGTDSTNLQAGSVFALYGLAV